MKNWETIFFEKLIEEARTLTKDDVSKRNKIALEREQMIDFSFPCDSLFSTHNCKIAMESTLQIKFNDSCNIYSKTSKADDLTTTIFSEDFTSRSETFMGKEISMESEVKYTFSITSKATVFSTGAMAA